MFQFDTIGGIVRLLILRIIAILISAPAAWGSTGDRLFNNLRSMLDYNNPIIGDEINRVESRMIGSAYKDLKSLRKYGDSADGDLALNLIYVALYMTNTNNWVGNGGLSYDRLVYYRRFSRSHDLTQELIAREKFILGLIESAQRYRPTDKRIDSWAAGAKMALERYETRTVSAQSIDALIKAATDYPAFNLFTAILASREVILNADQKNQLLNLTLQMVGPDNPCKTTSGNDPVCVNGWKAPFNYQTAVALLGDVLAKQAEIDLLSGDASRANEGFKLAYTAVGVYSSAFADGVKGATEKWINRDALQERIDKTNALINQKQGFGDYWTSPNGVKIYQCSSCHSDAPTSR